MLTAAAAAPALAASTPVRAVDLCSFSVTSTPPTAVISDANGTNGTITITSPSISLAELAAQGVTAYRLSFPDPQMLAADGTNQNYPSASLSGVTALSTASSLTPITDPFVMTYSANFSIPDVYGPVSNGDPCASGASQFSWITGMPNWSTSSEMLWTFQMADGSLVNIASGHITDASCSITGNNYADLGTRGNNSLGLGYRCGAGKTAGFTCASPVCT